MVEWKGDISPEKSGGKAARLDQLNGLNVPNFFVITREEVQNFVADSSSHEKVINAAMPQQLQEKLEKAYDEIGMSSEVREASGKAKSLVGGQREKQRVSVRISSERQGMSDYRLNVGPSEIEEAVKEVVASFYSSETEEDYPAVIVQKMVEPGYTGAAITSYMGNYQLFEAVEGLGISLESGITQPMLYLLEKNSMQEFDIPQEQVTVKRNQMTGSHERQITEINTTFEENEIVQLFQKLEEEDVGIKFVYKRGTFYIVDAFPTGKTNPFDSAETTLSGVRVSEGEIEGSVGREVEFSDETLPPDRYQEALIARKGGYTSSHAQLARQEGKPAVFSFSGELEGGQRVSLGSRNVEIENRESARSPNLQTGRNKMQDYSSTAAAEMLPLNRSNGLYLSPPFSGRYAVTDREVSGERIPRSGYLTGYGEIFSFDGDKVVVDVRKLPPEGLEAALEYLDADLKALVVDQPSPGVILQAIESGFDVFATPEPERLEKLVRKQEKKFMIEKLRELSK